MNGTARTTIAPGSCTNGLPRRRPAGAVAALDAARGLRCSIGLMDDRRPRGGVRVRWVDAAYLGALAFMACGGQREGLGSDASAWPQETGVGNTATCNAGAPDAGVCNAIRDEAPTVTPTCAIGAMPAGTGGTIADATYVLVAQTYYHQATCPTTPLSGTIVVSGNCLQEAAHADLSVRDAGVLVTLSSTFAVQGNNITFTTTCRPPGGTLDAPAKTFAANGSTLTFFTVNSAMGNTNSDRVEVFMKQ